MHHEPSRVRALPVLARSDLQRVGEGAHGGEPKVLPPREKRVAGIEPA